LYIKTVALNPRAKQFELFSVSIADCPH